MIRPERKYFDAWTDKNHRGFKAIWLYDGLRLTMHHKKTDLLISVQHPLCLYECDIWRNIVAYQLRSMRNHMRMAVEAEKL